MAALTVAMWGSAASAEAAECPDEDGCVFMTPVTGLIDPVVADYLTSTVERFDASSGYHGIVLALDSTGVAVDDEAFATLIDTLVASEVPVSVWVGPSGAEATGGAAEFVAAMGAHATVSAAPATAIGDAGAQRLSRREHGELFGDGASVARTSLLSPARALEVGLIERIDPILGDHVLEIDGVGFDVVEDDEGRPKRQPTVTFITQKLSLTDQLFHTVASPAVAYLLTGIAIGLLLFEFFTAGIGIAGVIGAGCGVLAGYGLGALPTRGWAIGLCLFAGLAFAIDVQTALPRFWTAVGLVSWTAGSLFLFEGLRVPWIALISGVGGMAVAMVSGMPAMVRSRFGTPTIGRSALVGREGVATVAVAPEGVVEVDGARWRALTNRATPIAAGESLRVVAIDGLTLEVEPLEGAAVDYREMRDRRHGEQADDPSDHPVEDAGSEATATGRPDPSTP